MSAALCATIGSDGDWFPDSHPGSTAHAVATAPARSLCVTCPAKGACLDLAMTDRRTVGIFAGLDEAERRRLHQDGTIPADYGYCGGGLHLSTPENTGTTGNCLPCRRINRAERARIRAAVPMRRRANGRASKTVTEGLEAAA